MKANKRKNNKIFRLNNGTIQVYGFEPIRSSIEYFRLNEMKKIDEDERVITRDYNRSWFAPKKGIVYECDSYVLRRTPPKNFKEKEDNYLFIYRFINGLFRNASVHVMDREDKDGELIILNPKDGTPRKKVQLTHDLYLEYLLENERFAATALQEADLTKEKSLFSISDKPIIECSMDSLTGLIESGLVRGDVDEKLELLEGSTKVYEKLKQKSRTN